MAKVNYLVTFEEADEVNITYEKDDEDKSVYVELRNEHTQIYIYLDKHEAQKLRDRLTRCCDVL